MPSVRPSSTEPHPSAGSQAFIPRCVVRSFLPNKREEEDTENDESRPVKTRHTHHTTKERKTRVVPHKNGIHPYRRVMIR